MDKSGLLEGDLAEANMGNEAVEAQPDQQDSMPTNQKSKQKQPRSSKRRSWDPRPRRYKNIQEHFDKDGQVRKDEAKGRGKAKANKKTTVDTPTGGNQATNKVATPKKRKPPKPHPPISAPSSYFASGNVRKRCYTDRVRRRFGHQNRPFPSFKDHTLNAYIQGRVVLDDNHLPTSYKVKEESHWQTMRLLRSVSFDNDHGWHDVLVVGHDWNTDEMEH